jgi:G3E family GTPase
LRLQVLIEVMTPLITSQIKHADLIIVNKIDLASPDEVAFACRTAQEINPQARVRCACARQTLEPALMSEMVPWLI